MVKSKTEESYQEKHEHIGSFWVLYYSCKQIVLFYVILYKNKHVIGHLTEGFESYIPKFNVLNTALLFTAGIVAETIFNVRWLRRSVEKET